MDISQVKAKFEKTLKVLGEEYNKIQGSRTNPQIIEDITVEVYGSKMPIQQVGTVTVVDPTLITVQCWDKNNVEAVKKAIAESDLEVTPSVDGDTVRVPLPPLTEERRKELVKIIKKKAEDAKVAIRNIRREFLDSLEEGGVSEDELDRGEKEVQKLIDEYNEKIESLFEKKEKELLTL